MKLQLLDILVIVGYIALTIVIGLLMRKRAAANKKAYMLGGNSLPWYMLGLSNASGMFDISGTMWLVMLLFIYGLKSAWIPWLWPTFNQVFLMIYLSGWLRKSEVSTGAEWIGTRFGNDRGARLSHNVVVIFALVSCLGFLAYGFIGLGKFVEIFLPWEVVGPYVPFSVLPEYVPHVYGVIFTLIATIYAVLGGMRSIVWVDVLQYTLMTLASFAVAWIAMKALSEHSLQVPEGWLSPWFGWQLDLDWTALIPEAQEKIGSDGYELFSIFMGMMLFKGILVSAAGPAPNYDMQKVLSTRSPKEAALMSGFVSVVLFPVRYLMIAGFAILGLIYFDQLDLSVGGKMDFEQVLPSGIDRFIPAGLTGLLLAGLLAAFMSTFAGTLNAAQAYLLNDIYLRYVNPNADSPTISRVNYLAGAAVVGISIVLGFFAGNVNNVLQWLVSGLFGSYVVSNVLKWYWWRLNGYGYFWGMLSGLIAALVLSFFFPNTLALYLFPAFLIISLAGCIAGTYAHPPTDSGVLVRFYEKIRPWGVWEPVLQQLRTQQPNAQPNQQFASNMVNIAVGTIWQIALVLSPIYFVLKENGQALLWLGVIIACSIWLKFYWYDRLEDEK